MSETGKAIAKMCEKEARIRRICTLVVEVSMYLAIIFYMAIGVCHIIATDLFGLSVKHFSYLYLLGLLTFGAVVIIAILTEYIVRMKVKRLIKRGEEREKMKIIKRMPLKEFLNIYYCGKELIINKRWTELGYTSLERLCLGIQEGECAFKEFITQPIPAAGVIKTERETINFATIVVTGAISEKVWWTTSTPPPEFPDFLCFFGGK